MKDLTLARVAAALQFAGGICTIAADQLECQPSVVRDWVRREPQLKALVAEITESNLDLCRAKLLEKVGEGSVQAISLYHKLLKEDQEHQGQERPKTPTSGPSSLDKLLADAAAELAEMRARTEIP